MFGEMSYLRTVKIPLRVIFYLSVGGMCFIWKAGLPEISWKLQRYWALNRDAQALFNSLSRAMILAIIPMLSPSMALLI